MTRMGMTAAFTIVAVASGLVAAGTLLLSSTEGIGASAVIRAVLAGAGAGMVGLFVLEATTDVEFFGIVHLGYLGATVSIPMVGVAVLARSHGRPHGRWALPFGAALLVPALVGFYATHIEPYRLREQRVVVSVDAARTGHDHIRIAVLADLQMTHVGSFERKAIDRLLATKPDVILVAGDLFQSPEPAFLHWLPKVQALLGKLRAPGGVFVVQGDVDGFDRANRIFAHNPDAHVLDDELVRVEVRDRVLRIAGTRLTYDSRAADTVRRRLDAMPEDGSIRILLSHRPDTVSSLPPSSRVDLTVAGHTHGGQVVLPGFGPLMTLTAVPRAVAAGGLHTLDGNRIYVSPGVGVERLQAPQIRFADRPTIGVVDLADR